MQDHEAIQTLLDARGLAYESLARAFAEEPNGDVALLFASEDFAKTCSVLDDGKGALPAALADVAAAARRQGAQACKAEYGRWFVAQEADVYPWESVHVTGERVLFQRCTLEVREAYRAQGFQAAGYPHEPDDHLATGACTSWAGWRLAPRGNVRRAKRARAPKRLWRRLGS